MEFITDIFSPKDDSAERAAAAAAQEAERQRQFEREQRAAEVARADAQQKAEKERIAAEARRAEMQLTANREEAARQAEASKVTGAGAYQDTASARAREIVAAQKRAGGMPGFTEAIRPGAATAGMYLNQSNMPVATTAPTLAQSLGFTQMPGGRKYTV